MLPPLQFVKVQVNPSPEASVKVLISYTNHKGQDRQYIFKGGSLPQVVALVVFQSEREGTPITVTSASIIK